MDFDYFDLESGEGLSDYELHQRYDDMLDECYEPCLVTGSYGYQPSRVLKAVDPIAYRVGFCDWLDSELGETIEERQV